MNVKYAIATVLAALGTSAAIGQEATPDTWMHGAQSSKSRLEVSQEAQAARANGDLDVAREYDIVDRRYVPMLSRAEVLADLEIWRLSGMAALDRGEAGTVAFGPEYRKARDRYAAMRASPEFAALVQLYASRRGELEVFALRRAPSQTPGTD